MTEPSAEAIPWPLKLFCDSVYAYGGQVILGGGAVRAAHVIETAFAEREAAKDAEIARYRELAAVTHKANMVTNDEAVKLHEQMDALRAEVAELVGALKRNAQGWDNALELGLLPVQHEMTALELAEASRAIITKHGASNVE